MKFSFFYINAKFSWNWAHTNHETVISAVGPFLVSNQIELSAPKQAHKELTEQVGLGHPSKPRARLPQSTRQQRPPVYNFSVNEERRPRSSSTSRSFKKKMVGFLQCNRWVILKRIQKWSCYKRISIHYSNSNNNHGSARTKTFRNVRGPCPDRHSIN